MKSMSAFEEFLNGTKKVEELNLKKPVKKDIGEEVLENQKTIIQQNKKIIELLEKLLA